MKKKKKLETEQEDIFTQIAKKEDEEKNRNEIYINGRGEPLPWETDTSK